MHIEMARQLSVELTLGYHFHPTTRSGGIQDVPLTSSSALVRLRAHLKEMGSDDAETLHGFRSRCAITLALLGAELSETIHRIGWRRRHTTLHCLRHRAIWWKRRRWRFLSNCVVLLALFLFKICRRQYYLLTSRTSTTWNILTDRYMRIPSLRFCNGVCLFWSIGS